MRNPALHILFTDLVKVLENMGERNASQKASIIFNKAVPYHIKNRYMVKGDARTIKAAKRNISVSTVDSYSVEQFNGLLYGLRTDRGDRRIQKLVKGGPDWNMLKEIKNIAIDFSNLFQLPVHEGVRQFLIVGLKLMGKKYSLSRFKYYASKISETYEAQMVLQEDTQPAASEDFYNRWCECMEEYGGGVLDILVPEKFIHIIYARQEADEAKADYTDWITAQFEKLAFLNAIPELSMFYGDNAKARYDKYMLEQKASTRSNTGRFEKAKEEAYNLPESMSQEQADYFAALRAKKAGK